MLSGLTKHLSSLLHQSPFYLWRHLDALTSPSPERRRRACEELAKIRAGRPFLPVPALLQRLADLDPSVRKAAFEALCQLGERQLAQAVAGALADEEVACRELRQLTEAGDTRATQALIAELENAVPDQEEKLCTGLVAAGPACTEAVIQLLGRWSPVTRRAACAVLRSLGEERLAQAFEGALEGDPDALTELQELVSEYDLRLIPPLRELQHDPVAEVRAAATQALARTGDVHVAQNVLAMLRDRDAEVREAACRTSAALGDAADVRPLFRVLSRDDSPAVRAAACEALGQVGLGVAVPRLIEQLAWVTPAPVTPSAEMVPAEPHPEVRAAACRALGQLGARSAVPPLIDSLSDPHAEVRRSASDALAAMGDASAQALTEAALSWNAHVREAACSALGKLRPETAEEAVVRLLGDEEPTVRKAAGEATRALGKGRLAEVVAVIFGGERDAIADLVDLVEAGEVRALEAVSRHTDHAEAEVRATVRDALNRVGPQAVEGLRQRMAHEDENSRVAASRALEVVCRMMRPLQPGLLCEWCLTRYRESAHSVEDLAARLLVCRSCGRASPHLRGVNEVVAVLDHSAERLTFSRGVVRGNWFEQGKLFDFDSVEIVDATDYEVERLCIEVGNDTDAERRRRCTGVPCVIGPECELEPSTIRILDQTFGEGRQVR